METIVQTLPRISMRRIYALESRLEFLRLLRTPSFAVPTLVFPVMSYLLFAVLFAGGRGGFQANVYLLATYGVFGVTAPSLFGFGVSVALDRERGWLTLKRAQPMPRGAYLAAKLAMAMLFAAIIFAMLAVLATTLGSVRLPASAWLSLLARIGGPIYAGQIYSMVDPGSPFLLTAVLIALALVFAFQIIRLAPQAA